MFCSPTTSIQSLGVSTPISLRGSLTYLPFGWHLERLDNISPGLKDTHCELLLGHAEDGLDTSTFGLAVSSCHMSANSAVLQNIPSRKASDSVRVTLRSR